ncbi:hypothetical protein FRB96_003971 [Tulasnella sp. 330]|nr:hypothetical protein FRB96_003971 [Tulasnella sp. 330]KAG8875341.1 hypothetical protein FRB97_005205 [Tulasnella sp. 331]KAG8880291.1 hypothetical protein FRB98_005204 [Tulasnella sp. 332]
MTAGDSRSGLDEVGAAEVRAIMQSHRVNFDQARLIRHNQILARNGIDPSGMPLDSKAPDTQIRAFALVIIRM